MSVRGDGAQQHRGAVRIGARHPLPAHHAAGARHVLDHDVLAKNLAHALGHDPAKHVNGPASSGRNDDLDGLARPILRVDLRGQTGADRKRYEDFPN